VKDVTGTGYDAFENTVQHMPGENEELLKKLSV
jgi:hypothetical protein